MEVGDRWEGRVERNGAREMVSGTEEEVWGTEGRTVLVYPHDNISICKE